MAKPKRYLVTTSSDWDFLDPHTNTTRNFPASTYTCFERVFENPKTHVKTVWIFLEAEGGVYGATKDWFMRKWGKFDSRAKFKTATFQLAIETIKERKTRKKRQTSTKTITKKLRYGKSAKKASKK